MTNQEKLLQLKKNIEVTVLELCQKMSELGVLIVGVKDIDEEAGKAIALAIGGEIRNLSQAIDKIAQPRSHEDEAKEIFKKLQLTNG
jgi:hypothetical protein